MEFFLNYINSLKLFEHSLLRGSSNLLAVLCYVGVLSHLTLSLVIYLCFFSSSLRIRKLQDLEVSKG